MGIKASIKPRERILSFGMEGTGKSNAILNVARYCPDNHFWVFDNDNSYERLLATDYTDVEEVGNVHVFDPALDGDPDDEWKTLTAWTQAKRQGEDITSDDDWVVIDSTTPSWDDVQTWYVDELWNKDIAQFFMESRKEMAKAGDKGSASAFEGFKDWSVINKEYSREFQRHLLRMPCHLYITAERKALSKEDLRDPTLQEMYGQIGARPGGQKRIGHLMQTVLYCGKKRTGEWVMTTVKDRGRVEMDKTPIEEFAFDYLVERGLWVAD